MADAEYIAELEAELKWLQREHVKICSSESKLREALNPKDSLLWMDIAKQKEAESRRMAKALHEITNMAHPQQPEIFKAAMKGLGLEGKADEL